MSSWYDKRGERSSEVPERAPRPARAPRRRGDNSSGVAPGERRSLAVSALTSTPHQRRFYFCCLTFFYMKVHSLIHASGIVVFSTFCMRRIDISAASYFFLTIKLGWCTFFVVPRLGRKGGGRVLTVRELFIAYPRRTGFPLFLFVMNYVQWLFRRPFLSLSLIAFCTETINLTRVFVMF